MAEEKKMQGWVDVQITPDMPLTVLINFMNVLNQRLVALEDTTQVPYGNKMITLTEFYAIQAEQQAEAMRKQAKEHPDSEEPAPEEHHEEN